MRPLCRRAVNNKQYAITPGERITLQLEQHALAGRYLRTSLPHSLECPRHLLFIAARYSVGEYVHVIPVIEQVQGRLQHTNMRLVNNFRTNRSINPVLKW